MPRVAAPDFRSFAAVARDLAQERLERQRIAQASRATQSQARIARERMGLSAQLDIARMQQQREIAGAGLAMQEWQTGLREDEIAQRALQAQTQQAFRQAEADRASRMRERQQGAKELGGPTYFDPNSASHRPVSELPATDPRRIVYEDNVRKEKEEAAARKRTEGRAIRGLGIAEAKEARQQFQFEGQPTSPEEAMGLRLQEEERMRAGGLGRYYQQPQREAGPPTALISGYRQTLKDLGGLKLQYAELGTQLAQERDLLGATEKEDEKVVIEPRIRRLESQRKSLEDTIEETERLSDFQRQRLGLGREAAGTDVRWGEAKESIPQGANREAEVGWLEELITLVEAGDLGPQSGQIFAMLAPATRAAVRKELKRRGFVTTEGK